MNNKKRYNKHYVKRDPSNQKFMFDKNGDAVPGDLIRDTVITQTLADELNQQSANHGFVWIEAEDEVKDEKSDARLALEKEADELGIKYRDNISDNKLQEKINKTIEE